MTKKKRGNGEIGRLRKIAKSHDINSYGRSKQWLIDELTARGVSTDPANYVEKTETQGAPSPAESVAEVIEAPAPAPAPAPKRVTSKPWRPAHALQLHGKKKPFRYRWISTDPGNIDKKLYEGWEICNKQNDPELFHDFDVTVRDGKPVDGTKRYRDLIVAKMPEDTAKARDAWVKSRTENQTAGVKRSAQEAMRENVGPAAHIHGHVKIID